VSSWGCRRDQDPRATDRRGIHAPRDLAPARSLMRPLCLPEQTQLHFVKERRPSAALVSPTGRCQGSTAVVQIGPTGARRSGRRTPGAAPARCITGGGLVPHRVPRVFAVVATSRRREGLMTVHFSKPARY
jgi:hypothetical protein